MEGGIILYSLKNWWLYACFSPPIPHQAPGIGGRATDRLVPQIPQPLGPSALLSTLFAFPIASQFTPAYLVHEGNPPT